MTRHFRRVAVPTPALIATAILGVGCAVWQLTLLAGPCNYLPGVAIPCYVASGSLFWWAVSVTKGRLAACGQGCVSAQVVTEGPYRYVRHPFYSAYNLAWIAGWLTTGSWELLATAVVMATVYESYAREEECGFMEGPLEGAYSEYRRRTGRYLPGIR